MGYGLSYLNPFSYTYFSSSKKPEVSTISQDTNASPTPSNTVIVTPESEKIEISSNPPPENVKSEEKIEEVPSQNVPQEETPKSEETKEVSPTTPLRQNSPRPSPPENPN